jgi:hypothetical protein
MRKVTIAVAALTLLVAGYVLAQVTSAKLPTIPERRTTMTLTPIEGQTPSVNVTTTPEVQILDKVGLRVEGSHDGRVYGTLVANINGKWVDVQLGGTNMRAGQ